MQKISKSGCAIFLVACPVLIVAVHRYLAPVTGEARIWFSVASGLLLATGLSSLWLLVTGKVATRDDLLGESQRSQPPADGETLLASGPVRAEPPLLTAPISGTQCVAYFYRMYRISRGSERGSMSEEVPVYWGYAARPLVVETPFRSVAVETPQLLLPRTPHSGEGAVARAREYVRTATAEIRRPQLPFAGDPVLQWMTDIGPDEDGGARRDWKSGRGNERVTLRLSDRENGSEVDPATLHLEELVLPPGVEVSVHGQWSASRNAIAAGLGAADVRAKLAMGPPTALGVGAGIPPSLFAQWMGTLVTTLLGLGLAWFASEVWPNMK